MRPLIFVLAMVCATGLAACVSSRLAPPREPVRLNLTVTASPEVNRDGQNRAAPIVVRLYELKYAATFEDTDFFSLQDKDRTVLADDLISREQFQLRPGESRTIQRDANQATTVLGIVAAYRDLPHSVWRASWPLPPAPASAWYRVPPTLKLKINLDANAIVIFDEQQNRQLMDLTNELVQQGRLE
ncbi:type VI secretion system lipoprotein TssJ [Paraburkholderia edwinii]|uniref:Type VI secretion system lipoprotein TssJ n=1 Tax=Paraburkholderia edwinii TaxID=2861782 RepID=A0ABX8UKA3_9BURK|nr:type VI secretion system lipoprotein TssJ [Paraburkholderia edwinii]QYD69438.1 type VI secretion system lipoprotein TssJ [Paraburkholderia edwinii]